MIFVGDDWAEDHHDVYVMDGEGARLASRRLPEGLTGIRVLHELIAGHAAEPGEAVIGIETDRGLWVQALGAAGYQVFAVNPLAVAATATATRFPGRNPMPATPKSWRTWSAPTGTPTRCAARCGSTTRQHWRPSTISPTGRPGCTGPRPPHRPTPRI